MDIDYGIPVNPEDLPSNDVVLDDGAAYRVELKGVTLSPKTDKNGKYYCAIKTEVNEGDYEGFTLTMNYLPLPYTIPASSDKKTQIRHQNDVARFSRFCKCFGINKTFPGVKLGNAESMREWQDFVSRFVGNPGAVTVRNEDFNGRTVSRLSDFIV